MHTKFAAKMAALHTAATSAAASAYGASGGHTLPAAVRGKRQARPFRSLRGREIEQSGNFLGLELLQDITPEIAHTTEKPIFGLGQSSAPG